MATARARSEGGSGGWLVELFAPLARAPLELLARRQLLRRTDTKFLVPAPRLEQIIDRLRGDYLVLDAGAGVSSSYVTDYLDTEDLRCFHDHRRGRRLRQKVRVRRYPQRSVVFLEVKSRRSDVLTVKRRLERPSDADDLRGDECAFLAEHCRFSTESLEPVARVAYRRATLLGASTDERVTIDVDLEVGRGDRVEALGGIAIVEVKQPAFSASTAAVRALRGCGLRWQAVSKYCTAVALTRDGVRCNRFLPALRKIERMRT